MKSARMLSPGNDLTRQIFVASGNSVNDLPTLDTATPTPSTSSSLTHEVMNADDIASDEWLAKLIGAEEEEENSRGTTTVATTNDSKCMTYGQIFKSPWCCTEAKEEQFKNLMGQLFQLQLDDVTSILVLIICMFNTANTNLAHREEANERQEYFTQMLYRYLCSKVGRDMAVKMFPKYVRLPSLLEEMTTILEKETLKF